VSDTFFAFHEPASRVPPPTRPHAPPAAEGRSPLCPRGFRRPAVRPRSPLASRSLARARPFPRPPGSDTIPIACRTAVPFNTFYLAGLTLLSLASRPHGPPDKSLFVSSGGSD
jgi:hypothetical protein